MKKYGKNVIIISSPWAMLRNIKGSANFIRIFAYYWIFLHNKEISINLKAVKLPCMMKLKEILKK